MVKSHPKKSAPECPFECGGGCKCYLGNAHMGVVTSWKGLPYTVSLTVKRLFLFLTTSLNLSLPFIADVHLLQLAKYFAKLAKGKTMEEEILPFLSVLTPSSNWWLLSLSSHPRPKFWCKTMEEDILPFSSVLSSAHTVNFMVSILSFTSLWAPHKRTEAQMVIRQILPTPQWQELRGTLRIYRETLQTLPHK